MTKNSIQNLKPETRDVLEMMYAVRLIYKINDPKNVFKKIKESILDGTFSEQSSKQNFNIIKNNLTEKKECNQNFSNVFNKTI